MRIIKDEKTVRGYLEKYEFQDIFSFDISPYATVVFFDAGDEICRQDERPEYLYYIFEFSEEYKFQKVVRLLW